MLLELIGQMNYFYGEIIVNKFYQKILDDIDSDDEGIPTEEVYKMLGIWYEYEY